MRLFFCVVLLALCADVFAYGVNAPLFSVCSATKTVSQLALQKPPRRVLLIPLLSGEPGSRQGRWAEQPADAIAAFYRSSFNAKVKIMRNVWNWQDFYNQAEQSQRYGAFDRVIFIGHGGFDGPVLNESVYRQEFELTGGKDHLRQLSEAQPGLNNSVSIQYDRARNPEFADYIDKHLTELAGLNHSQILALLKDLEKRLQPLNERCFQRYCAEDKLARDKPGLKASRMELCERICREPLYEIETAVAVTPERFFHFTNLLTSLTAAHGLLFFGACNPGSAAPNPVPAWVESELLINSSLAGGPYRSYVHLLSAATGRVAAGPIGRSSGDDVVNRIMMFENNRKQRYLCVASPSTTS